MNRIPLQNYNLHITLLGGQSFGWDFVDGWYYGFTSSRAVKLRQEGGDLVWQTYPVKDDWEWLSKYLRLDVQYDEIIQAIQKDQHIERAISKYPNLRLLNQGFEDALVGFLCSPTKSIVGIRQCVRLMAQKYSEIIKIDDKRIYLFPRLEALAESSLDQILECKVGFRGQNIIAAAQSVLDTDLRLKIHEMPITLAREELMKLRGIGDKVADCILVYGLMRDEVTPFDVWGKRVMTQFYGMSEKAKYEEMRQRFAQYYGGYSSWAGQFLFEYIRSR